MVRSFDAIDQLLWIVAIAPPLLVLALCDVSRPASEARPSGS